MAFAKITGNGLTLITILVTCLWGCLIAEHRMLVDAHKRQNRELLQIRHLRDTRVTMPAAYPKAHPAFTRPVSS